MFVKIPVKRDPFFPLLFIAFDDENVKENPRTFWSYVNDAIEWLRTKESDVKISI